MKMIKRVCIAASALLVCVACSGCGNKDMFDTNYTFDRAIIALPNGEVVEVEIDKWTDYEDGNQIQIITEDGTVYLTSTLNCTLINDK